MKKMNFFLGMMVGAMICGTVDATQDGAPKSMTFESAEDALRSIAAGKVSEIPRREGDDINDRVVKVERYELARGIARFCARNPWDIRSRRLLNTLYLVEAAREISKDSDVLGENCGMVHSGLYMCDEEDHFNGIEAFIPCTKLVIYLLADYHRKIQLIHIPGWREKYRHSDSGYIDELWRISKAKDAVLERFPGSIIPDEGGAVEDKEVKREVIVDKALLQEYDAAIAAYKHREWVLAVQPWLEDVLKSGSVSNRSEAYFRKHPHDVSFEKEIQALGGLTAKDIADIKSRFPKLQDLDFSERIKRESGQFDKAMQKAAYACRSDKPPGEAIKTLKDILALGGMSLEYPAETPGVKAYRLFRLRLWLRLAHLIETKRDNDFDVAKKPSTPQGMDVYRAKFQWNELAKGIHDQIEIFINEEYSKDMKTDGEEVLREIKEHIKSKEQTEALKKNLFSPDYRSDVLLPGFSWPTFDQLMKLKP